MNRCVFFNQNRTSNNQCIFRSRDLREKKNIRPKPNTERRQIESVCKIAFDTRFSNFSEIQRTFFTFLEKAGKEYLLYSIVSLVIKITSEWPRCRLVY